MLRPPGDMLGIREGRHVLPNTAGIVRAHFTRIDRLKTRKPRSLARLIGSIAVVLALTLAVVVLTPVVLHQLRARQIRGLYDQLVEQTESREYRRAPDPPGWALELGSAAELYIEALESCPQVASLPSTASTQLNLTRRALNWHALPDQHRSTLAEPGSGPIPEECLQAGVPEGSDDRLVAQLDADVCQLLLDCDESLNKLQAGSRREDTRSPLWLWSDWGIDPAAGGLDQDEGYHLRELGRFLVVRGHIDELRGESGALLNAGAGAIRVGTDLTRGAHHSGQTGGLSLRYHGVSVLVGVVQNPTVSAGTARALRQELSYLNRQPLEPEGSHIADALGFMAASGFTRESDPYPPFMLYASGYASSGRGRFERYRYAGDLFRIWRESLAVQESPYPERQRAYRQIAQDSSGKGVMVEGHAEILGHYDTRITLSNTRLLLLELASAAVQLRLETGTTPTSLEDLLAFDPDLPTTDPLTGDPFEVFPQDDHCIIRSPAAHPARGSETGLDRLPNIDPEERLLLRIPAPPT